MSCLDVEALTRLLSSNKTLLGQFVNMVFDDSNFSQSFHAPYWHRLCTIQVCQKCALTQTIHPSTLDNRLGTLEKNLYPEPRVFTFYRASDSCRSYNPELLRYYYAKQLSKQRMLKQADLIFQNKNYSADLNYKAEEDGFNPQVQISPCTKSLCLKSQLQLQFENEMKQIPSLLGTSSDSRPFKDALRYQLQFGNLMPGSFEEKINNPTLLIMDSLRESVIELFQNVEEGYDKNVRGNVKVITPRFCTDCGIWMVMPKSDDRCYACRTPTTFISQDVVRICVQVSVLSFHSFSGSIYFKGYSLVILAHMSLFFAGP